MNSSYWKDRTVPFLPEIAFNTDRRGDIWKAIAFFVIEAFLLSALFDYPVFSSGILSDLRWGLYCTMWGPGLAGLATLALFRFQLKETLGLRYCRARYLVLGAAIPVAYSLLAYSVVLALGGCGMDISHRPRPLEFLIYLVPALFRVTGEEIGWRGVLFPLLRQRVSFRSACMISGFIWAAWHYASMAFGGYNNGSVHWYSFVNFTLMVMGATVLTSWLREHSGSLIPSILFHTSHNFVIQHVLDPMVVNKKYTSYLTSEFGVALALVLVILSMAPWYQRLAIRRASSSPNPC